MAFTNEQIERNPRGYLWVVAAKARARGDHEFASLIEKHTDDICGEKREAE